MFQPGQVATSEKLDAHMYTFKNEDVHMYPNLEEFTGYALPSL